VDMTSVMMIGLEKRVVLVGKVSIRLLIFYGLDFWLSFINRLNNLMPLTTLSISGYLIDVSVCLDLRNEL